MNQRFYKEYEKFIKLEYHSYKKITKQRTRNNLGAIKGSELIIEIAKLSAFFTTNKLKEEIDNFDACNFAFWGWKLSYDLLEMNASDDEVSKSLNNAVIEVKKYFDKYEVSIEDSEIEWLIYCCALIKKELYEEFQYNMFALMLDGKSERINVAFTALKQDGYSHDLLSHDSIPRVSSVKKIGRNDLCTCGSGKKYKKCCIIKYQ
ncbi:SEC-C metal-binding domain-containing protein [Candidatus Bandiella numerosa]|uniref:SEC-C metal-binding domain-containing protein n=1 Tax=Candidatus Bandiella numerosa TaxID=2570586 RepID=UPI001F408E92|nr:SEC-C metal-binding domain-containing protein [Candidatus Bandiella numerosa]